MSDAEKAKQSIEAFLFEYEDLCRRYGLCFQHEDQNGQFLIAEVSESALAWTREATRR